MKVTIYNSYMHPGNPNAKIDDIEVEQNGTLKLNLNLCPRCNTMKTFTNKVCAMCKQETIKNSLPAK